VSSTSEHRQSHSIATDSTERTPEIDMERLMDMVFEEHEAPEDDAPRMDGCAVADTQGATVADIGHEMTTTQVFVVLPVPHRVSA
jgi:hypothetical protein